MHYIYTVLETTDIERIHKLSLQVLANVGMKIDDDSLCTLLGRKGLAVNGQTNLVRFPTMVVEEALKATRRDVQVRDHCGNIVALKNGTTLPAVYENAIKVWDWHTASVRPSTLADLRACVQLAEALPDIRIACPACLPGDLPQPAQLPVSIRVVLENSCKMNLVAPHDALEAEWWFEAAAIADQDLPANGPPSLIFVASPTSPLQLDPNTAGVIQTAVEKNVPVLISSCPMAGTTSPATMAGTTVLTHAEFLGLLTITQLLSPGASAIYGGSAGPVDLRYGTLSYGAPERHTMLCANIDIANHFSLPHFASAGSIDSALPDFQTGQAKALAWLTRLMKGTILGLWFGGLLTGSAIAPEQIILDVDAYRSVRSMLRGLPLDDDRLAYDVICRVGPGGSFLTDEHTLRWMRSDEFYLSRVANLQGEQGTTTVDRAHQEVTTILADFQSPVAPHVQVDLQRFCSKIGGASCDG